jgi:hypothetical protein
MMALSTLFLLISSKVCSKNFQFFFISNVIRCYEVQKPICIFLMKMPSGHRATGYGTQHYSIRKTLCLFFLLFDCFFAIEKAISYTIWASRPFAQANKPKKYKKYN